MAFRRSLVRRAVVPAAAAFTAVAVLSACGGGSGHADSPSDSSPSAASSSTAAAGSTGAGTRGGRNAQDVSFAQGMIPHHRQAVAMAALAPARAKSARVKDLAGKIERAQDPEITTMSGWLKAWGETVPDEHGASGTGSMPGMHHSGSSMPGMMSDDDMAELKDLAGARFDKAFLDMMIAHHQGAVAMARTEQTRGSYGPARKMAESIVESQSAEITRMRKLLGEQ
ncbi:DUF305 domain-containing protein [Streptomyces sp. NPDC003374]